MGIRIPVSGDQNVQNAFRDVEQEIEDLKAALGNRGGSDPSDALADLKKQVDLIPPARFDSDENVFVAAGPQHAVGLVPDPGPHAGTGAVLREDGLWADAVPTKLAQAEQTPEGPHDIYNIPGALHVAGPMQSGQVTTDSINAWSHPGLQEAHGGTLVNPNGILATINVIAWSAPYACSVLTVKGYRVGGTSASINARRNGADNHLSSALSLTSTNTWMDGGAVQNVAYAAGDKLEIMLTAVGGDPTQVGIQVTFRRD